MQALQIAEKSGVPYLYLPSWEQSGVCGHGFSLRFVRGGSGKKDSFDLGFKGGEKQAKVWENRARFLSVRGRDPQDLFCGEQIHGDGITLIGQRELRGGLRVFPSADGLITSEKEAVLGALSADCLIIYFLEPDIPLAAIAHAGWRGACRGIAWRVVEIMKKEYGAKPEKIQALFSPSIAPCCYEVGEEVIESCSGSHWSKEMVLHNSGRSGHYYFDLQASNRNILLEAGIRASCIFDNNYCTKCNYNLFFSYRGAGGVIQGIHMGIIFLK